MSRILAIRGGAIGDFILTLPALRLLREGMPAAQIELLGYESIIALAVGRRWADAGRSIEYGPLAAFFARNAALPEPLAEWFAGFPLVVSWLFDPDGIFEANLRRAGVKHFVSDDPRVKGPTHAARHLAQPLESLALYLDDPAPSFHPNAADLAEASALLGENNAPLFALHPGSGGTRKNWLPERWSAVARRLLDAHPGSRLLLCGGEADETALEICTRELAGLPVLLARGLPLPVLGAALARVTLFLGHDSGVSHLAAAAGARCLLLFGPTEPAVWAPLNPRVQILRADSGDLAEFSIAQIHAAAERALDQA